MTATATRKTLDAFRVHGAHALEACGLVSDAMAFRRVMIESINDAQRAHDLAMLAHEHTHERAAHDAHDVVHAAAYAAQALVGGDYDRAISYADRAEWVAQQSQTRETI